MSIAQVNLKLIWDVVSKIKVGEHGRAYVVDSGGRLIAHPDISLVLRNTDMSRLAQVQGARASTALRFLWRWRHDRSPLPEWVADVLDGLVQKRVEQAHEAQAQLRFLRQLPPRPPRPLSGACVGYFRKPK